MEVKRTLALLALAALLVSAIVFNLRATTSSMTERTITVGTTTIHVEVADTPALREQGLSGRPSLAPGQGMLFVFEEDDEWAIWMKDMRFAIDIVWADAAGKVVTVADNVSPDTYPQAFAPTQPARYVLELPAGFANEHGIAEGTQIVL